MMQLLALLLLSSIYVNVFSLNIDYTIHQNGTVNDEAFTGISLDYSGLYYLIGSIEQKTSEDTLVAVVKRGVYSNFTNIYTPFDDFTLAVDADVTLGLFFICGKIGLISNSVAFVVACGEEDLAPKWSVDYIPNGVTSQFNSLIVDASTNSLYVVGFSYGNQSDQINQGLSDAWISKLEASSGDVLWDRLIGSSLNDSFNDVSLASDGTIWTAGFTDGSINGSTWNSNGTSDFLLVQFSQNGEVLTVKQFGSYQEDIIQRIAIDLSSIYLLGNSMAFFNNDGTPSTSSIWMNLVLFRMDIDTLEVSWAVSHGAENGSVWATGLDKLGASIYVSGYTSAPSFEGALNNGTATSDILFAIFDDDTGNMEYAKLLGSTANEQAADLVCMGDQVKIVGFTDGSFGSTNLGGKDVVLISATLPGPSSKTDKFPVEAIIAIAVVGTVLCLGLAVAVVLLVKRRKRMNRKEQVHSEPPSRKVTEESVDNYHMSHFSPIPPPPKLMRSPSPPVDRSWIISYNELVFSQKIGQGAFGEVYKGKWRGSSVAIKRMLMKEGASFEEFAAEAELMKKLRPHSNITQFMGVCEDPFCIVTEYVSHGSLQSFLRSNDEISDLLKIRVIRDTASGMLHLHTEGIIHRDLAARNILLDKTNRAKVSDFGMSRITNHDTRKTVAETGPIAWMSPEALLERIYNTKTDVWSFGVVIFEVLTRKKPFQTIPLITVATEVPLGKLSLIPELEAHEHEYPPVLVKLAKMCLKFKPQDRPEFQEIVDIMIDAEGNSSSLLSDMDFHVRNDMVQFKEQHLPKEENKE